MGSHAHCVVCGAEWRVDIDHDGEPGVCSDCREEYAALIEVIRREAMEEAVRTGVHENGPLNPSIAT